VARVLVTGAAGFIGAEVVAALAARGDAVAALDRAASPRLTVLAAAHPGAIRVIPCEITEWPHLLRAFQESPPEAVVHCAAVVGVVNSAAAPLATLRVNIEGSLGVMEAMRLFGVRRMVNLSSEEIYGPFDAERITEDHPARPVMPYGISKYAVEQLARDHVRAHGGEIVHVRTCWVYGPGLPRPRVPKTLLDAALAGRPLHLPAGGDFRVDHTHVEDTVQGILLCLDRPGEHRFDAYHIATGAAPSLAEVVAIVRDLVPGADLSIGPGDYAFAEGVPAVRKGALDITRARTELGYAPRHDIRSGLAACVAAHRAGERGSA
jgi:UDP-glucose 4-epimerase